ncbi:helix-turn-helix domain-containing protein [Streptomyces sp. S1A]|uniref:helix-turn-helix domain-containing protein n=1 Tax=Streptomyces sp. ICN903 TaxID=2964654 RepID=UPI001EDB50BF|nr:helix-turn-helix domain-containing protein [Streptomyces sp. ICN903]MCG3044081.1 helix-turn-helix domain-containing protein [Streptomyces sp. ICN903]
MSAHRITEESVIVGGYTALLMATALRAYMRRGGFDAVHPQARAELDASIAALAAAGNASQQLTTVSGTAETPTGAAGPESSMTVSEAAQRLGLSERHIRNLAESNLGGRKVRGGWRFDPTAVEFEAARRNRKEEA